MAGSEEGKESCYRMVVVTSSCSHVVIASAGGHVAVVLSRCGIVIAPLRCCVRCVVVQGYGRVSPCRGCCFVCRGWLSWS
jgi:hypothetical protein